MSTRKPWLILPVESQVREFDAKLLLACVAAERGHVSILGYRSDVDAEITRFPRGTYLSKSLTRRSRNQFRTLQRLGHEIGAWDEEALVYPNVEYYFEQRMSVPTLRYLSLLLAWGNDNADVFRKHPSYDGAPIYTCGNPRIDLLRPELRATFDHAVRPIRERYGRFLLLNTNFSKVSGRRYRDQPRTQSLPPEALAKRRAMKDGYYAHKQALFEAFLAMTPAVAKAFPDHRIIVRPHPSELREPWEALAEAHENLHVVDGGNVIPWLLAADATIHNGCTTAIEAFALGRPSIAYRPVTSERWDHQVPNALSRECESQGALTALLARAVAGDLGAEPSPEQVRLFDEHVVGLSGALASDRVVDALESHREQRGELRRPPVAEYLRGRLAARRRRLDRERSRRSRDKMETKHAHRFPGIPLDGLREKIERLDACLGRFEGVRVEQIAEKIFRIEA